MGFWCRIDDVPGDLEDEGDAHVVSAIAARLLPGATKPTNEELVAICQAFVEQLRNGTAPWVVQRLHNTYGPMPTDHYSFSFWMALVRRPGCLSEAFSLLTVFLTFHAAVLSMGLCETFPNRSFEPGCLLSGVSSFALREYDWPAHR